MPVMLTDDELALLADALHEYRDKLTAVRERFDLAESETLTPAPGSILATLKDADSLLARLEAC